ncbi:MAG: porin [Dokdonella sp.]|nr:porin [Dokdonella sp.]
MRKRSAGPLVAFAVAAALAGGEAAATAPPSGHAAAYGIDDWPTHVVLADGSDLGLSAQYQFDTNRFSGDRLPDGSDRFADETANRRKELGFYLRKKGVYDLGSVYDFWNKQWLDTYARVQSKALFGVDYGAFRIGYTKTPVGFEGVTSSRATSFLETALPVQAFYENRRTGVDWALERPRYLVNLGYYFGQDLQGDNDGTTVGGRFAVTPLKAAGQVLHLGVSASRESPDASTDGRGRRNLPSIRPRARPEAGLTPVRLVDTGNLGDVDTIDRLGLEALWIDGPWSVQGELLTLAVERNRGLPDFRGHGYYVFGSWIVTGESRPYSGGNSGNVKPKGRWGALEWLLRYSAVDLDDGTIRGGRQHDWTLGANWYLTPYFKFQANYVKAASRRQGLDLDPAVFQLRAQVFF